MTRPWNAVVIFRMKSGFRLYGVRRDSLEPIGGVLSTEQQAKEAARFVPRRNHAIAVHDLPGGGS